METNLSSKSAPIVIVGAGVFGLSTAIHLAERGYTNVKVLDKQPYHDSQYSYNKGCDAASAGKFQRHSNSAVLSLYRYQQDHSCSIWERNLVSKSGT